MPRTVTMLTMDLYFPHVTSQLTELYVAWRRWRLLHEVMDTGVSCSNCADPTATMTALKKLERNGIVEIIDDQVVWHWPA